MRRTLTLPPDGTPRPYAVLEAGADPAAALAGRPAGLLLRGAAHGRDVVRLAALLAVHEAEAGLPDGAIRVVAVLDTPGAVLRAASFAEVGPRLAALAYDGAAPAADGPPQAGAHARALVALAAGAAGIPVVALDGPQPRP